MAWGRKKQKGETITVRWLNSLTDLLLPPTCLRCGCILGDETGLCAACWRCLTFITPPFCVRCGHPFALPTAAGMECGACLSHPPPWSCARSALSYDDASRPLLLRLKHGDRLDSVPLLARWLHQTGNDVLSTADLLLPVPLHPWRLWTRRYNQSAELSRAVSTLCRIPTISGILHRTRSTPSMGRLSRRDRQKNIEGAFRIDPKNAKTIYGKTIVLIDDVMTSGATSGECARVLMDGGARAVNVLTVARVLTVTS